MLKAINDVNTVARRFPVKDSLFIKIQGSESSIKEASKVVEQIVKKHKCTLYDFGSKPEEAEDIWSNRKNALFAALASVPNSRAWTTDVWSVSGPVCMPARC